MWSALPAEMISVIIVGLLAVTAFCNALRTD
jgi:hypothetical protein